MDARKPESGPGFSFARAGGPVFLMLLLLPWFSQFSGAISSEEAAVKAKPYLDSSLAPLPKPFYILSDTYFIYSPSIYSPKRLFVAVSDRSGDIESDEVRLAAVGASAYNYGILEEYVRRNKVSFADMLTPVRQTVLAVDTNTNSLGALSSRTQQSYPSLNFDSVDAKAMALERAVSDFDSLVSDGAGLERQFESDYTDASLQGLLGYYERAFKGADGVIAAYDGYNTAISLKVTEVFKSSIPAPDNENIVKNLENMRLKVDLFENLRYLRPSDGLGKLSDARAKWVNDSIASFLYKKLTVDVKTRFDELKPSVESVFYGEAALAKCGLADETASIKGKWQDVLFLYDRGRESDFQRLPAKLDVIRMEYEALNAKYAACTTPVYPSGAPQEPGSGNNYLPFILLAFLAAAGYFVYRYKQSQEETYQ